MSTFSHLFRVTVLACALGAHAATTDLATAPLSAATTDSILPNILFILDDSGSMEDDAMPDWAKGAPLYPYPFPQPVSRR